jgi:hypothetical protein
VNQREKALAITVGGILLALVAVVGLRVILLKPLKTIDKNTAILRDKLAKISGERRTALAAQQQIEAFVKRTFSDQVDQASAKSGEMVTKQILLSGLRESDFSRLPIGPRKLRGASEIGWNIQGQGKLANVINLVFLLQESAYLHRIENLAISAGDAPGDVRVGFRFLTLVIDPAPVVDLVPLVAKFTVDSAERQKFDGIVERDLLRPYVKRSGNKGSSDSEAPAVLAGPAGLRVVSLSEWMGQPEVHVRDTRNQKTQRYKHGDDLAGGTIVGVDYRPLPFPGNEALKSFSRVILKIGNEYWAIERGQTLADKRRLAPEQLPADLAQNLNLHP